MQRYDVTFQLTSPTSKYTTMERVGMVILGLGVLTWIVALGGGGNAQPGLFFWGGLGAISVGAFIYFQRYFSIYQLHSSISY